MCGRNVTANSDVEFLLNLIHWIEFNTAELRYMNRALNANDQIYMYNDLLQL